MAIGQEQRNQKVVPQAMQALSQFKYEVATELGINPEYKSGYWGNISSRECGAVGGHMVRRMIAAAEQSLANQQTSGMQQQTSGGAGFPLEPDAQQGSSNAHNQNEQQMQQQQQSQLQQY